MNNKVNLEKYRHLRKHRLDPYQYTLALLQSGHQLGLLDQEDLAGIQSQVMELLAAAIQRYTRGESTSVKNETAQRIMLSMFYAMDAYLRTLEHPDEALQALQTQGMAEIHRKGLALLESCLQDTAQLCQDIKSNQLSLANYAYQSTINEALPDFFNHYDVRFAAQDTMAGIDYPLLLDDMKASGLFYIRQYLQKLALETLFCRRYSKKALNNLLGSYGRTYRINPQEALINVFEIVATNAIFSLLVGNPSSELNLSSAQLQLLQQLLLGLSEEQRKALIESQVERLCALWGESTDATAVSPDPWAAPVGIPSLRELFAHLLTLLLPRLNRALEHGHLENVVMVSDKAAYARQKIIFEAGVKMDDELFRDLVERILACRNGHEKAALIIRSTESLGDFIDVLEADCLFDDEYQALYARLGEMELSLLARMLFNEEMRIQAETFSLQDIGEKFPESQWQAELLHFLLNLPAARLNLIEQFLHSALEI